MYKVRTEHDRFEITVSKIPDGWVRLGRWLGLCGVAAGLLFALCGRYTLALASVLCLLLGMAIEGYGGGYTVVRVDSGCITLIDRMGEQRIDWRRVREVRRARFGLVLLLTNNYSLHIGTNWPRGAISALWDVLTTTRAASPALPDHTPPEDLRKLLQPGRD